MQNERAKHICPIFHYSKKMTHIMTHIFKVSTVITLQYETENEVEEERDGRQKQLINNSNILRVRPDLDFFLGIFMVHNSL